MKSKASIFRSTFYLLLLLLPFKLFSQQSATKTENYKVGDKVDVDYLGWYPAKVVEVLYNGDQYKAEVYPRDGGKPFIYTFPKFRLRPATLSISTAPENTGLIYGKYGCTSSSYRNGYVQYTPRGSFTITKSGQYTYFGFEKPTTGTYVVDKKGNLLFKGGYFNAGQAEKIDRPNKFFVVFPANPDNRWTCGLVDDK
jgi:hypothetical protein